MEHIIIEDKYHVMAYDINLNIRHLFQGEAGIHESGNELIVHLTHEEDVMHLIRFLVVNGRTFKYNYGGV